MSGETNTSTLSKIIAHRIRAANELFLSRALKAWMNPGSRTLHGRFNRHEAENITAAFELCPSH
jgi:hypothetical protein